MFIIGYFLEATAMLLHTLLMAIVIVVLARAVLSWVSPDPYNPIVRIIIQLTEPLLFPIRKRVPYLAGVDLSPMILMFSTFFLDAFLVKSLERIAYSLLH
ncbi:MAG: YggT family protein [Mariprofundaceae bacterium]